MQLLQHCNHVGLDDQKVPLWERSTSSTSPTFVENFPHWFWFGQVSLLADSDRTKNICPDCVKLLKPQTSLEERQDWCFRKSSSCLILCQKDMVWQNGDLAIRTGQSLRAVNVQYTHGSKDYFWLLTAIQIQDASNFHVCQMLHVGWIIYQLASLYLFLQCFWTPLKHKLPASKFQVVALLQKSTTTKTDSQYFHPTWIQKISLEMYLQPKPNNRTPKKKKHSSTSQRNRFQIRLSTTMAHGLSCGHGTYLTHHVERMSPKSSRSNEVYQVWWS